MPLTISSSEHSGVTVVRMDGEIDLTTVPELGKTLEGPVEDAHRRIVADLSGVGFCDSKGLAVLVAALRRVHASGGSFVLVRPQPSVLRLLRITCLDQVFSVYDSLEDALRHVPADGGVTSDGGVS